MDFRTNKKRENMKQNFFYTLLGAFIAFYLMALYSQTKQNKNFDEVYSAVDSLSQIAYKKIWDTNLDSAKFYSNQFEVYHQVKRRMLDVRISQLK